MICINSSNKKKHTNFFFIKKKVSAEKPVFLRESFNKTYSTSAYFWGRTLSELPFHFLFPTILVSVVYYAIGLNDAYPWKILYMS